MIRPLDFKDRESILSLLRETRTFSEMEIRVATEVLDACIEGGDESGYLIFCHDDADGVLRGYICFGPVPLTDYSYDIYWIAVAPHSSRRGLGTALLGAAEKTTVARGGRRIYLDTSSTAPYEKARRFYEKSGYRRISILPDFYRKGDDKIIYMKEIAP